MTDFIAALLDGQEERERREALELEREPGVVLWSEEEELTGGEAPGQPQGASVAEPGGKRGLPGGRAEAVERTAGRYGGHAGVHGSGEENAGAWIVEAEERMKEASPLGAASAALRGGAETAGELSPPKSGAEGLDRPLSSPVWRDGAFSRRQEEGVAWLDGAVRRSLAGGRSHSGEERVIRVERRLEPSGRPVEPETLDRLFRRDARRYDGGFQLL